MLTFTSACVIFLLDVVSKRVIRQLPRPSYALIPGLRVTRKQLVRTTFLRQRSRAGLVLTWLIALASVLVLIRSGQMFESAITRIGVGAALGGALGNLIDVVRRRAITDFVDVGWWPVFNLADVGIVAGLVLAFWPMV